MTLPPPTCRPSRSRARFWPLWCGAVLLPGLLLGVAAWVSWGITESAERERVVQTVRMLREQALRTISTQQALLAAVQARIAGMDWDEITRSQELPPFLRALRAGTPGTHTVGIACPNGTVIHDGPHPLLPVPSLGAPDGPPSGSDLTPTIGRIGTETGASVMVSQPREANGRPDGGLLWASLPVATFESFYRAVVENPDDHVALLRTDGRLLVGYPPDLAPPPAPKVDGPDTVRVWSDPDFLRAAAPVSGLPLTILYAVTWRNVQEEWRQTFDMMVLIAAAATLLLLGLTWRVSTHARREERALLQVALEAERRAEMEAVLRRGQRMETLGRVVAGVAHDFRNVVQALTGGAELAQQAIDHGEVARTRVVLKLISDSALRADQLTQRMLRIAQDTPRATTEAPTLALRPALESAAELIRRTLGGGHTVRLALAADQVPAMVRGDEAEFQATLLNLG